MPAPRQEQVSDMAITDPEATTKPIKPAPAPICGACAGFISPKDGKCYDCLTQYDLTKIGANSETH